MSNVTRRQVATGAAWAVPVLAVGAAAPAMAASPNCPVLSVSSATAIRGGVTLVLSVANPNPGYAITSLTTVVGSYRILTWAPIPAGLGGASVTLDGTGTNSGNDYLGAYTVSYTVSGPNGAQCVGSLSFTSTR
jgi:hypothetical protein